MEIKKKYTLTVSPDVFAEKTEKVEIARLIRENGYVTITYHNYGTNGRTAVVSDGIYDYDIPADLWKWFKPYAEIATLEEVKAPEPSPLTTKFDFIDSGYGKCVPASTFSLDNIKSLSIQSDFGIGLEKIEIIDVPGLRTEQLMKFIMEHILNEDPLFVMDSVLNDNAAPEEKEAYLWELYKLYQRKLAVNHVYDLISKERNSIQQQLAKFEYNRMD